MEDPEKLARIIEARLKLKARFEQQMQATPSMADDLPKGSGKPNRHGMPTLPIGQTATVKWPVLDLGYHPRISPERWRLTIDGAVEHPVVLTWKDFLALPQTKDTSDFHCVTTCRSWTCTGKVSACSTWPPSYSPKPKPPTCSAMVMIPTPPISRWKKR